MCLKEISAVTKGIENDLGNRLLSQMIRRVLANDIVSVGKMSRVYYRECLMSGGM